MVLTNKVSAIETDKHPTFRIIARKTFSAIFLFFAAVGIALTVTINWLGNQVLDSENWVRFVTPLPQKPQVAEAMTEYITGNIFEDKMLRQSIDDSLPEEADFLAPTLSRQFREDMESIVGEVVSSREFSAAWISGNQEAHDELMSFISAEDTNLRSRDFRINLSSVKELVASKLDPTVNNQLGISSGSEQLFVNLDLAVSNSQVSNLLFLMDRFGAVLPFIVIALTVWGVVLASDRRIAIIGISAATTLVLLFELIVIKAQRSSILNRIDNNVFDLAAATVYDSLVASLTNGLVVWIAAGIILWVVSVLAGPRELGIRLRHQFRIEELQSSSNYYEWQSFRVWLSDQKYYIFTVILMLSLFYLAFVTVIDTKIAVNTAFAVIAAIGFVQLMSTPPYLIQVSSREKTNRQNNNSIRSA